jgi:HTH-type transcriptional regulator/antitoxin HigA
VAAALQVWSPTFSKAFDSLPASVRDAVQRKVDEMGTRLGSFPHKRLEGRSEWSEWGDRHARQRREGSGSESGGERMNSSCELAITASFTSSTSSKAASFCTMSAIDVRFISGPISLSRGRNNMSLAELENVTKAWPPISRAVRVPRTDEDYRELVELLDRVTDQVGEDENHPLASLMDVLGVLIEKYEDEHVLELTE